MTRPARLLFHAVLAFLALPGTVAFLVPLVVLRPVDRSRPFSAAGLAVLVLGSVVLLWCVRDFYVAGRGTLAPWAPPQRLVQVGLYRYSRNPMYIGVLLIVAEWALGFRSPALWTYALAMAVAFHLRVLFGEEPWLARTHGAAWAEVWSTNDDATDAVRRWAGSSRRGRMCTGRARGRHLASAGIRTHAQVVTRDSLRLPLAQCNAALGVPALRGGTRFQGVRSG